jgi:hypothetical protein
MNRCTSSACTLFLGENSSPIKSLGCCSSLNYFRTVIVLTYLVGAVTCFVAIFVVDGLLQGRQSESLDDAHLYHMSRAASTMFHDPQYVFCSRETTEFQSVNQDYWFARSLSGFVAEMTDTFFDCAIGFSSFSQELQLHSSHVGVSMEALKCSSTVL